MLESLPHIPARKRSLLSDLLAQLCRVEGMVAVVLGGSYASGSQHEGSDLDIGLYYAEDSPFPIEVIRRIAANAAQDGKPTVTGFYEWGAWVNGGAWIHTPQGKVDFLYRNLDQVQRVLDEAHTGISQHDYDQQPAYGFYSVIYLAETQICCPLYDPYDRIRALKRQVQVYPTRLKARILVDSLWSAEFTLLHAHDYAAQADVYNTVGCLTRAASSLTQALFALNERYFLRDKSVMEVIAGFPILPPAYVQQVSAVLAHPGSSASELDHSVQALHQLWLAVVALAGDLYQPKFNL